MRSERRPEVTAMRPYSLDLRERVAAAIDHHEGSIRGIARVFRVSTSFIVRLLQRRRAAGTLAPEPHGGGPPPALGPDDQERLAGLIREQPDATLEQLRQRGGFTCSLKTLWLALRRRHLRSLVRITCLIFVVLVQCLNYAGFDQQATDRGEVPGPFGSHGRADVPTVGCRGGGGLRLGWSARGE